MMLASYLSQWGYVDKVWLTLSPRNPLKDPRGLIPDMRRLSMLNIATKGQPGIETCDIELSMPRPSYTVNTLVSGEILSDTLEEGDLVEKDQLLYTLDSSDAATSQNEAQKSGAKQLCPGPAEL